MNKPEKLSVAAGQLQVPAVPIIPFIAGDGIGPEIWQAARQVFDAAVKRVYGNERRVEWKQELAGQVAYEQTGSWLPAETLQALRTY
ncbi:MAG: isocitrate/isopropylmalate family dehydrogenase, partial [Liquorilactobacillus satsumensis]